MEHRAHPARRTAVITGGSGGIGRALARALSEQGWTCVLLAREKARLSEAATALGCEFEVCDVGRPADVERAAGAIGERHPAVSLLVNSAGRGLRTGGGFLGVEFDAIEEVVKTNYLGSVLTVRAFLPHLERGAPSDVVNVVSIAGYLALARWGPYAASKHAQLAFSRSIGFELEPRGIAVHTVSPGPIDSPSRASLPRALLSRAAVEPDAVAESILAALEGGRSEVFVPRWYRAAVLLGNISPRLLHRLVGEPSSGRAGRHKQDEYVDQNG